MVKTLCRDEEGQFIFPLLNIKGIYMWCLFAQLRGGNVL